MQKDRLDAQWQQWLNENLARGCDTLELMAILQRNHFSTEAIKQAMGAKFPSQPFAVMASPDNSQYNNPAADYKALTDIALTRNPKASRFPTNKVQLYTFDDFLDEEECDRLITLIDSKLRPSTVTVSNGDDAFRTSLTCDLCEMDDPFVKVIDEKIAQALGINLSYSEGIQGQHYQVTQEFKAHTDYFEPGSDEFKRFAGERGQRTWTFMIYLKDTRRGGHTHFVNLDAKFAPKKGQAVIWNNLYASGRSNPDTLHHAQPIEKGSKTIITKWFRDKGNGDMFGEVK